MVYDTDKTIVMGWNYTNLAITGGGPHGCTISHKKQYLAPTSHQRVDGRNPAVSKWFIPL